MTSGEERWALPPLTLDDRCDFTCNAPALLRIIIATGDLYACNHHFEANAAALRLVAVYVQDERMAPRTDSTDLEEVGRMHMRRGLTHADPCRWCFQRLVNRRFWDRGTSSWREYFLCETCDMTEAEGMRELLKGLTR
jgi:hypothetical protein